VEEYIDHGDIRDWRRRCSDRAERGGRQEIVRFGSEGGLHRSDRIPVVLLKETGSVERLSFLAGELPQQLSGSAEGAGKGGWHDV
jgi:hypothetical protein